MINIPSKSDKQSSQLRDGLRIMAWQQFKADNRVSGLEGYEAFSDEWNKHEIQKMNLKQIQKVITDLGYSDNEILQIRSEYYRTRERNGNGQAVNGNGLLEPINNDLASF